jgi:hypothetical protein
MLSGIAAPSSVSTSSLIEVRRRLEGHSLRGERDRVTIRHAHQEKGVI